MKDICCYLCRYLCCLSEDEIRMPNTRAMADLMLSAIKVEIENESRLERYAYLVFGIFAFRNIIKFRILATSNRMQE